MKRLPIRLLPLTVLVAGTCLGIRVSGLWPESTSAIPWFEMSRAAAQTAQDGEQGAGATSEDTDASSVFQQTTNEDKSASGAGGLFNDQGPQYSRAEVEMLQSLVTRREELDNRERELELRTNLLTVAEKRVEERITELKKVESKIQSLLKQYDEQQEEKLQSLVKLYQAMKPAEAARVLETLDMSILIEVADRMSERRMAPIMAAMDPARAKEITTELATRKKLPATGG
jgi:flagellar motility protein MotE (MotC chaperone)